MARGVSQLATRPYILRIARSGDRRRPPTRGETVTISAINYEGPVSGRWAWTRASVWLGAAATLLFCWDVAYGRFIVEPAYKAVGTASSGLAARTAYDHYSFLKIFAVAAFIAMWFLSAAGVITGIVGLVKKSRRVLAVTGIILSVCPWLLLLFIG